MMRKIVWSVVAVLVVAVAVAVVYWQQTQPMMQTQTTKPQMQVDNSVVGGSVTNVSASSITVTKPDGSSATFSVTPDTKVISRVSAGQTGKSLTDLSSGTMVIIVPNIDNSFNAKSIAIVPPPPAPSIDSKGIPVTFAGTVIAVNAGGFTVISTNNSSAMISVAADTQIFSNVQAGQKGKTKSDIKVGSLVQVSGTTGTNGVNAQSVFVADL